MCTDVYLAKVIVLMLFKTWIYNINYIDLDVIRK